VGENKKNIAAAESNKKRLDKATKRLDKATKKRSYDASKKLVEADIANEENDYSAIENDNSDPTEGSTGTQNKPYENWKVREDKRNIAEAKALKARLLKWMRRITLTLTTIPIRTVIL
jgi:hypothetical protein